MRRRAQPWLGTLVEITVGRSIPELDADQACTCAFHAIASIHALMSFHDPDSDVSRINQAVVDDVVEIHPWTAEVLRMAIQIKEDTNGIFDVSCASKLAVWGYLPRSQHNVPTYIPGGTTFTFETTTSVRKTTPGWIDLGGIAKGYAVDRAVQILEDQGIATACVNAGGDLRAFGDVNFPVAIRDPLEPTHMRKELVIRQRAMATSATYFTAKEFEGRHISTLINARNGQPVIHGKSISVIARTCMVADALTKYVAVTADPLDPVLKKYDAEAFII